MHQKEVCRICLGTDLLGDAGCHRYGGNARGTDQRIDLALCNDAEQLSEHDAAERTEDEGDETEKDDLDRVYVEECFSGCRCTDGCSEQDNDDVHKSVGSRLCQLVDNAALAEQVSEHQHTDERSCCRKNHTNDDRDDDREEDLLELGDISQLSHLDFSLLFCREKLHDRRLDDRDERHIRICSDSDRSEQSCLSELGCKEDGSRAVSSADNGDGSCGLTVESEQNGHEIGHIDTELCCGAHKEGHRVRDQRTEVGHRADTHEDKGRKDGPLIQLVEIIQKTAGAIRHIGRMRDNIRIDINKKHTERDRYEQKRLISFCDCQIQEEQSNQDHDVVSHSQIEEGCLSYQI